MIAALLTAASLCLLLGLHPFLTYPLALSVLPRRARRLTPQAGSTAPRIAVCVCAYNEAGVIASRIENLLSLRGRHPLLEILVYVDTDTDGTAAIVGRFADRITAVIGKTRQGKTHGMNCLVAHTDADIIVFSDANVLFAPDAVAQLAAPFDDPDVGCVCGHLRYPDGGGATAAAGSLYWRLEEYIKSLESATGSVMGADGSIFAIRRSLHQPPPVSLIDDMFVSLSILCRGARIVRAPGAMAYEDAVATSKEEFQRKIRIACQAFNVHRVLWPQLRNLPAVDRFKYVSHKLLRWLSIYFLAAATILFAASLALAQAWYVLLGFCAAGAIAAGAITAARRGPLAKIREIVLALCATGIGVVQSIRGHSFQTWTPSASARAVPALAAGDA
jgi:cellulose synthase/poly-beta-1,6-N-acetylglucosamine synthase-like glycosyltransferase